jgi:hypothetical protein
MLGFTNSTPTYRGGGPSTKKSGGILSGFLGYLFGGIGTPSYKGTAQTQNPTTSWLSLLGVRTPTYKAAPSTMTQTPAPNPAPVPAPDDGGTPDGPAPDGCTPNGSNEPPIYVCIR